MYNIYVKQDDVLFSIGVDLIRQVYYNIVRYEDIVLATCRVILGKSAGVIYSKRLRVIRRPDNTGRDTIKTQKSRRRQTNERTRASVIIIIIITLLL